MTLRANDPAVHQWQRLLRFQRRATLHLAADLQEAGTTSLDDYDVLYQLSAAGGTMRMSDLAEATVIARSSCTRVVDRLVDAGLVERNAVPTDRRSIAVSITTAGRTSLRRAATTHLKGIDELFASRLDAQDLDDLERILNRLDPAAPAARWQHN